MIKRKLLKVFVIMAIFICTTNVMVYADSSNSVSNNFKNYVQPSNNVIKGDKIRYNFFMPEDWRNKVNVYRQVGQTGDKYLEKLSFYYSPSGVGNVINKNNESLFLTISVYGKNQKPISKSEFTIFTEGGYTFTANVNSQNNYKEASTRKTFDKLVSSSKSSAFLKKYLTYTKTTTAATTSKIYFKNSNVTSNSYIDTNGVVYIPIRDFAEAMGYDISWYEKAGAVKITKKGVSDVLFQNADNGKYTTKMINGRMYVTDDYLIDKWKVSVYIDKNNKVYIS